jgi:hypothetical protein
VSAPDSLRAELARLVDDAPVTGERLPQVHARARRIRRNRTAAALTSAVAAVVVAVLVATNVAGTNRSVDPLAPSPTKLPTGVLLFNLHGSVFQLPTMADRALQPVNDLRLVAARPIPVAGGKVLALDAKQDYVLVDPRQPGSARVLLHVDHFVPMVDEHGKVTRDKKALWAIPGVGPRIVVRLIVERGGQRVWVVTARTQAAATFDRGPLDMYAMDLSGRVDPRGVHLPRGIDPVLAGRTGIYASASDPTHPNAAPRFARIDRSGHVSRLPGRFSAGPFEGGYGEAFLSACCDGSGLRVFDADTGHSLPVRHAGQLQVADFVPQFSVDGRYAVDLSVPPVLPLKGTDQNPDTGFVWLMVDTTTGRTTVVPGTERYGVDFNGPNPEATWSGDRLVWTEQLAHRSLIGAYLPANGRSVVTSVPTRGLALIGAS